MLTSPAEPVFGLPWGKLASLLAAPAMHCLPLGSRGSPAEIATAKRAMAVEIVAFMVNAGSKKIVERCMLFGMIGEL